ncbi:MAG: ATP-binding cassette domain-containing protein [Elusimicrobiota bacterium]
MLEIKNLSFFYIRENLIFDNLNFSCPKGCFAVTGPNGSGKTTLIRVISKVSDALYGGKTEGEIKFDGSSNFTPSVVLQNNDSNLFCETAFEEVSFFCLNKNFVFKNPSDFFKHWGLENIKDIRTDKLSYGQKQKYSISLALSFSNRANLVLMDEPLAFLDADNIDSFKKTLSELKKNNTVLIFGHRFEELSDLIDGYFLLKSGKISEIEPQKKEKAVFIESKSDLSERESIKLEKITHKNMRKKVDFTLRKGEIKIVYGPNGSGKTTLCKIISGILGDFDGEIYLNGLKADKNRLLKRVFPVLANPDTQIISRKISDIFNNFNKKETEEMFRKLNLYFKKDYYVSHLSYGEKQKFLISYGVLSKKDLILIDEPFLSFDKESERSVFEVLSDYLKSGGSVLFFTHRKDISEVIDCDIIEL